MPYLDTLRGMEVVISGAFRDFDCTKDELKRLARRAGARHVGYDPRRTTDVFVRGVNPQYKYGSYGDKEAELAWKAPSALVIDGRRFFDLVGGKRVLAWAPNQAPPVESALGTAFVPKPTDVATAEAEPFTRDPDAVDRGLGAHGLTLNALAAAVMAAGFDPRDSDRPDCLFDLAWESPEGVWVAEVKSLTAANERLQLRLGLGQVLEYAHELRLAGYELAGVVLAVEQAPAERRWVDICAASEVRLVWPEMFSSLFA